MTALSPREKVEIVCHISYDNRVTGIVAALRRLNTAAVASHNRDVTAPQGPSSDAAHAPDSDTPSLPLPRASQPVSPCPRPPIGRPPPL